MAWETRVQSQVESYQRQKRYLMPLWLTLSIIWVKWSNPGKRVAPSQTLQWRESLHVALDYGRQLYISPKKIWEWFNLRIHKRILINLQAYSMYNNNSYRWLSKELGFSYKVTSWNKFIIAKWQPVEYISLQNLQLKSSKPAKDPV